MNSGTKNNSKPTLSQFAESKTEQIHSSRIESGTIRKQKLLHATTDYSPPACRGQVVAKFHNTKFLNFTKGKVPTACGRQPKTVAHFDKKLSEYDKKLLERRMEKREI